MTQQELEQLISKVTDPTAQIIIQYLLAENKLLKERIAVLEKNSSNSSKPPSSDIVVM